MNKIPQYKCNENFKKRKKYSIINVKKNQLKIQ